MSSRDMPTTKERLAARLDWRMGAMIRRSEQNWPALTLQKRRAHVDAYMLLRDCLAAVSGKRSPRITSPWTLNEIDKSAGGIVPWCWSMNGALTVEESPLALAVAVPERELRKTGLLPRTLNCKHEPVEGLGQMQHAHTVGEVLQRRRTPPQCTPPAPKTSVAEEERRWRAAAEAKIRAR